MDYRVTVSFKTSQHYIQNPRQNPKQQRSETHPNPLVVRTLLSSIIPLFFLPSFRNWTASPRGRLCQSDWVTYRTYAIYGEIGRNFPCSIVSDLRTRTNLSAEPYKLNSHKLQTRETVGPSTVSSGRNEASLSGSRVFFNRHLLNIMFKERNNQPEKVIWYRIF